MTSFHFLKNLSRKKKKLFYLEFVSAGIGGKGTNEMQYVLSRKAKATKNLLVSSFILYNFIYIQIWFINRCGFNILLFVIRELWNTGNTSIVLLIYYDFDFDFERVAVRIWGSCKFGLGFIAMNFLWPCITYFWSTLNLMCTVIINVP